MATAVPPKVHVLRAAEAPLALIFRRGPQQSWSMVLWNFRERTLEGGAWTRLSLYPDRSSLSPDGKYLLYFAADRRRSYVPVTDAIFDRSNWPTEYTALSRPPHLYALAAWWEIGSWTHGYHFVSDTSVWDIDEPFVGKECRGILGYGLAAARPSAFSRELRCGWKEAVDSPPRGTQDHWDETRRAIICKASPSSDFVLRASRGTWHEMHSMQPPLRVQYSLTRTGAEATTRPDLAWADWDEVGNLVALTHDGRAQIETVSNTAPSTLLWSADMTILATSPAQAPPSARVWA